MILATPVGSEYCITEDKQAVRTDVCAERYLTARSTGQDIHRFLPDIVDYNGDLIQPLSNRILKINFFQYAHNRFSLFPNSTYQNERNSTHSFTSQWQLLDATLH